MDDSKRDSWDVYFIKIAHLVATRSTCQRGDRGCVIVKDNRIIATGYNGVPHGFAHCKPNTCIRTIQNIPSGHRLDLCNGLHAEENAILQAARCAVSTINSTIYVTIHPCLMCAKSIIGAGITSIFYYGDYDNKESYSYLSDAGIIQLRLKI